MENLEQYKESFHRFKEMMGNPYRKVNQEPFVPTQEFIDYMAKVKQDNRIQLSEEQIYFSILTKLNKRASNNKFVPTDNQRKLMNTFWKYFKGIESGLDNDKGIFLFGSFGAGKTELLRSFVLTPFGKHDPLQKTCYVTTSIEMVDHYNSDSNFNKYFDCDLYIDDLGTEQRAKYMSKDEDPILSKFIELWYTRRTHKLFITSNQTKEELRGKYGGRVYSRLHQLCNFIEFQDKDHRI